MKMCLKASIPLIWTQQCLRLVCGEWLWQFQFRKGWKVPFNACRHIRQPAFGLAHGLCETVTGRCPAFILEAGEIGPPALVEDFAGILQITQGTSGGLIGDRTACGLVT